MSDNTRNVRVSFMNRVQDDLETTEGLTVRWPGTAFGTSGNSEWIAPHDLGFTPLPINANSNPRHENWTFQINCFARMGESPDQTSAYRIDQLVDLVIDTFRWLELDVGDWTSGGSPVIGTLQFLQPDVTPVTTAISGSRGDQRAVTLPAHFDDT